VDAERVGSSTFHVLAIVVAGRRGVAGFIVRAHHTGRACAVVWARPATFHERRLPPAIPVAATTVLRVDLWTLEDISGHGDRMPFEYPGQGRPLVGHLEDVMVLARGERDGLSPPGLAGKKVILGSQLYDTAAGRAVVVPKAGQLLPSVEREHAIQQGNQ
jgi:hypothetical protein